MVYRAAAPDTMLRPMFARSSSLVCSLGLTLAACAGGEATGGAVQQFGGATMGSTYEVKFTADVPVATVRAAVERELAAIDLAFSQWRDDSEISRCNAHASTEPFPVSPRFADVLALALRVAAATDGAFDPTVKPLSDLYRAAKRDPAHHLDAAAVAAARARVDFRQVQLREGAVCKQRPDVQLDLDGLVAGAADDAIAARLHELGVHSFFLQVTGEVLAHGEKAPGVPWVAGVVDPDSDAQGGELAIRSLPLQGRALCTSGDYRNGFLADGKFVHHVFDPRTGHNAPHRVVSVSVLADSAALADALGTAFLVLGDEGTAPLWPRLRAFDGAGELGALFLLGTDDGALRQVEFGWPK
jgi:FAD:protein FMN transferase